jgi:putative superfamily III holin-X
MANQDLHTDPSFSEALQRVVDSSQHVMLAHIAALRLDVKEDLGRALSSLLLVGAGVILINGAWLSLMAFTLQGLSEHLSLLASLAIVGSFTGLIGAGLALAGVQRLRLRKVVPDAAQIERADSAL